jgi:hypothetical protein
LVRHLNDRGRRCKLSFPFYFLHIQSPAVSVYIVFQYYREIKIMNNPTQILSLRWIHPPILYRSSESAFMNKMHDQVNHACKKIEGGGGNTCSILHNVTQTSLSSRSISSCVKFVEHSPLKNADISTRGLTMLSVSVLRNAIGRSCCMSTWLSWLFSLDTIHSLSCTHREMF